MSVDIFITIIYSYFSSIILVILICPKDASSVPLPIIFYTDIYILFALPLFLIALVTTSS